MEIFCNICPGFWRDLCGMQLNSELDDSLLLAYDANEVWTLR